MKNKNIFLKNKKTLMLLYMLFFSMFMINSQNVIFVNMTLLLCLKIFLYDNHEFHKQLFVIVREGVTEQIFLL